MQVLFDYKHCNISIWSNLDAVVSIWNEGLNEAIY